MTSTDSYIADRLNSDSVMEAVYSLLEERQGDRLPSKILQIMLEETGLSKGVLLLPQDNKWLMAATGEKVTKQVKVLLSSIPLQDSQQVPITVIQWVSQTEKILFSEDVLAQENLSADSYIKTHKPQFFACLPLMDSDLLKGIIYLESQEKIEKYSQQQLKVLNFICQQAAIALNRNFLNFSSDRLPKNQSESGQYSQVLQAQLAQSKANLEEAQSQLIAREKLATLGLLSAGVAHEIRNPLNFITNYAETSEELIKEVLENLEKHRDRFDPQDFSYFQEILKDIQNNASIIYQQGQRVEGIIRSMMQHARSEQNSHQPTDINELLDRAAQLAYHSRRASKQGIFIDICKEYDDSLGLINVAEGDLSRAFINLIDNACYSLETKFKTENPNAEKPKLWLTTQNQGDKVVILIRDNGEGIAPEIQEKLFVPFFTTKPIGEGTGLGLFLTQNIIVEQHLGKLEVESKLSQYAEFTITLPQNK
ncbi:ATP-binding protein [Spirulina sp. 06S082]|uniref:ATP-binding protein n=1 Tax=Spirulina sp. 06S082 TaxID=3110248 RepID=UPI002B1F6727|nr:ATP-binding protein [Spirulina sp. 06S082]MEA5468832.1 ATP-binding protein [Spirulina sp. 06S082]